jgi:uncharacterized protein YgiM (DUF1202 family)
MKKRIFSMLLLLALVAGFYAMNANAKGEDSADLTQTEQATNTAKPDTCKVITGIDGGTVNLRSCAGTSCAVLDILNEGETLRMNILTAGKWINIISKRGVTGWLNSKYCKRE